MPNGYPRVTQEGGKQEKTFECTIKVEIDEKVPTGTDEFRISRR